MEKSGPEDGIPSPDGQARPPGRPFRVLPGGADPAGSEGDVVSLPPGAEPPLLAHTDGVGTWSRWSG